MKALKFFVFWFSVLVFSSGLFFSAKISEYVYYIRAQKAEIQKSKMDKIFPHIQDNFVYVLDKKLHEK